MKRIVKGLIIGLMFASTEVSLAQVTINMGNGSTNACSGDFYDSGGSGGSYANSETYTFTICSNNGQAPYLNFTSFSIESGFDHLYIYDGPSASSALIGSYSGTTSPGTIAASGTCLTVVFTSDGSVTYPGWAATITCGAPAPPPATAPDNCAQADPFCTGTTYTFPANTNNTAETGPSYGCLFSEPNPAWYYMQIGNSGNIVLSIAGTGGFDVDFVCWGPFTSATAPCTAQLTGACATNHSCSGNIIDCSYSSSATETCTIPSGIAGQYYMICITNFSNQVQNITFSQSGGTGSTNCNIVCPTPTVSTATICQGSSTTLTATGSSTSYSWSPSTGLSTTTGSVVTASPTVTTTYSVVGTGTCTSAPVTTTVTVISTPTITVNSPTICKGSSATLNASGATSYSWSPSTGLSATTGASVTASPTVTTTYTVTGTTGSCVGTKTCLVTVNPTPTVTASSATICAGASAGLTASGASTYTWSPATGLSTTTGSAVTANPASTTVYTITGASAAGCTTIATATVTVNPQPTVTVNSPTICKGASAALNASGASTYTWSPTTGLSAGTGASVTASPTTTTVYTITATAIGGCTTTATSTVTVNPTPTVTVNSATICPGASTTLTASGANTYTWSPSSSLSASTGASVTANPTVTTNYTISATSAAGCTTTATATVTIGGAVSPTVAGATVCAGSSAVLTASGASTYTWSPATGLSSTTGATVTATPAVTTTYTINAASGACTGTTTAIVTVNPLPTITVNSPSICAGNSTALNAGGASTYTWNPTTGLSSGTGASVTANPTVTTTYTITGSTAAGCTATATSTVTVNPVPTVTVNNGTICNGGNTTLTAGGASTYTWSPGTGLSSTTGSSVTANPPSTTNYTVTGTSAAGCVNTATTSVTVVTNPTLTVASASICVGNSTTLNATGASTYTWSPATGLSATTGASVIASPASTTIYTITGTAGTCSAVTTATVTVNPLPTITANNATICAGQQTATLTASGASTYSWSPATGLSSSTGASVTANPASTTSYTITGTSAAGCVNTGTSTVTVNPIPTVTVNNGTICNGGSATLTAGGASTYTWSPATGLSASTGSTVTANPPSTTNYTVTGTSAQGCVSTATTVVNVITNPTVTVNSATICIGQQTATLTASGASTYVWSPSTGLSSSTGSSVTGTPASTTVYTVTGTAGTCTAVATTTITVNPLPSVSVNSGTICVGQQTATLNAAGASTYTWSPATGLSSSTGASVTANPTSTTPYTVTGTDANGCVNTATTAVTVNPLPTVSVNSSLICVGGSTTLNATGATTYSWNPSTGLSSSTGASVTANPSSTSSYTVTGTDANGCYNTAVSTVTVVANPTVTVNSATICIGQQTATLTASGASTYVWSPSTGLSSSTGSSVTGTPASTTVYTVTGTAGTCTAVATTTIVVNPLPSVSVNSGTICVGQQTATLNAAGASTYTWSPATGLSSSTGSSVTANPTSTTPYTVTATDINGCVNTATTAVTVNPLPTVSVNSDLICAGASTTLTASGATTYSWNPSTGLSSSTGASVTANPSSTSSYTVTGTDVNGCYSSAVSTVTVAANPTVTVNSSTICVGQQTATLTANGASSYVWSPSAALSSSTGAVVTATPTATTVYTVTGTVGTCTAVATSTVTVNPLPNLQATSNSPVCVNKPLSFTATGGSSYAWTGPNSFNSTQSNPGVASATLADAGTYTVVATDINGCYSTATVPVIVNPLPVVVASGATVCVAQNINLSCNNSGVSYSWTGPQSFVSNQQNPVIGNAATNMSGSYIVTVTDANGCASGNVANVLVNPPPVITASNNGAICQNQSLSFNATPGVSWSWAGPNGFISSSQTPVIANAGVNATGTYTVIGTDANGCSDTATTSAVVNPLPVVTASSSSICVTQQTATLTAGGAVNYTWTPAFSLNTATGATVNANPMVTAVYTVSGVDQNNCASTTTSTVTVFQLPTVTANSATICLGNSATLTGSGAQGYTWTPGSTLNTSAGTTVTATPSSSTSYTVTGTDGNGCYNTGVCSVTVNMLPVVTASSSVMCYGSSTTISAQGANIFSWSPPANLSASTGASVTANPPNTYTYTVTGTDINGCTDTALAIVTVNPLPVLNAGPQMSTGCAPLCVPFTNTTTATGSSSWNFGDGLSSTASAPVHCYLIAGTYNTLLTFTDGNGCVNTDTAYVVVYPVPDADFNYGPQPTTILSSNIDFTDASTGAVVSNWNWTFGDPNNSTSTVQNPSQYYNNAGSYNVSLTVTSNFGCKDSVTKTIVIGEEFMIYVPNAFSPNSDGTNDVFMAKGEGIKDFKMYIFDRWGNQVFYSDDITKGWDGRFQTKGTDIVQEDVYVWKIELTNYKKEPQQLKGTVTLLK